MTMIPVAKGQLEAVRFRSRIGSRGTVRRIKGLAWVICLLVHFFFLAPASSIPFSSFPELLLRLKSLSCWQAAQPGGSGRRSY